MPLEKDKTLEFKCYMKSDKMSYITYADIESLIKKKDGWENNPEKSSTSKIGEHIHCGHSMSEISGFDRIENKHTLYLGEDLLKSLLIFKRTRKEYN